jgi:AcrR family transcriptional regulator
MVMTPWGDAGSLRGRRLPPGRGRSREEVRRNQRERLYAAMVGVCAEKGYAEVSVADLVELSGVSSRSFYELFADKEDCLLATMEEILRTVEAVAQRALAAEPASGNRARVAVETFIAVIVAQPAAARLCMVTALCAGERPRARMDAAISRFAALMAAALEEVPGREGMPAELSEAILGGIAIVLYRRLAAGSYEGIDGLVPELDAWALAVPNPPAPLRSRSRRARAAAAPPPHSAHLPAERILRALAALVAEKGFAATTIANVATRARISQNTFYKHFRDKRNAFDAALEAATAQLLATTIPAIRRDGGWPGAVRSGLEAACAWLAAEPDYAHLLCVEAYAVGPDAVARRDRSRVDVLAALAEIAPPGAALEPLAMEATFGAVQALAYRRVRARDLGALADVPPLVTYLLLGPSLGAEMAFEAASG